MGGHIVHLFYAELLILVLMDPEGIVGIVLSHTPRIEPRSL